MTAISSAPIQLRATFRGRRLRLLALSVALAAFAGSSAMADDFTLDNVEFTIAPTTYRAKNVAVYGANLSKAEALKLLDAASSEPIEERLSRLNATKMTIPELTSEFKSGDVTQSGVYHDLVIQRVVNGKIETADIPSSEMTSIGPGPNPGILQKVHGKINGIHFDGVDLAHLAHVSQPRKQPNEPKKISHVLMSIASSVFDVDEGSQFSFGRIIARNGRAKALLTPMSTLLNLTPPDPGKASPPDPKTQRALMAMIADVFDSFAMETVEMRDFAATVKAPGGDGSSRIKRILLQGFDDSKIAEITFEGFEGAGLANKFQLEKFSMTGIDLKAFFETLTANTDLPQAKWTIPRFNGLDLVNFVTGPNLPADASSNISIGHIVIDAQNWLDAGPTSLQTRVEHAALSVKSIPSLQGLVSLGYDRIDWSGALQAKLDAEKRRFTLSNFSLDEKTIGSEQFSAAFANTSPEILSGNHNAAKMALLAVLFEKADLKLVNYGVIDRFVDMQAKAQGKPAAEIRNSLADSAATIVRTLLSNDPTGKSTAGAAQADAVAAFVRGAKTLDISVAASSSSGIGMIDLMMASQLGMLTDKLKIEAKAQ